MFCIWIKMHSTVLYVYQKWLGIPIETFGVYTCHQCIEIPLDI